MTCCIVLINPAATAASLPPLTCSSSSLSSATIGTLGSRDHMPAAEEHKGPSAEGGNAFTRTAAACPSHSRSLIARAHRESRCSAVQAVKYAAGPGLLRMLHNKLRCYA